MIPERRAITPDEAELIRAALERASVLRIDALAALGRSAEARAAARDYLAREPETETSARLRRLLESAQE